MQIKTSLDFYIKYGHIVAIQSYNSSELLLLISKKNYLIIIKDKNYRSFYLFRDKQIFSHDVETIEAGFFRHHSSIIYAVLLTLNKTNNKYMISIFNTATGENIFKSSEGLYFHNLVVYKDYISFIVNKSNVNIISIKNLSHIFIKFSLKLHELTSAMMIKNNCWFVCSENNVYFVKSNTTYQTQYEGKYIDTYIYKENPYLFIIDRNKLIIVNINKNQEYITKFENLYHPQLFFQDNIIYFTCNSRDITKFNLDTNQFANIDVVNRYNQPLFNHHLKCMTVDEILLHIYK